MTTAAVQPTVVGLGEIAVTDTEGAVLVSLGLGSCVCVTAYDRRAGVGGMAHIVLPDSGGQERRQTAKFADFAMPELFRQMEEAGATIRNIEIKLAGGSQMMPVAGPGATQMNIGERNIEAVKALLQKAGKRARAEDLGGTQGRTVRLTVGTGKVTVARAGEDQQDL